jgi:hypothetical protein
MLATTTIDERVTEAAQTRRDHMAYVKALSLLWFGKGNWHALTEAEQTLLLLNLELNPGVRFV